MKLFKYVLMAVVVGCMSKEIQAATCEQIAQHAQKALQYAQQAVQEWQLIISPQDVPRVKQALQHAQQAQQSALQAIQALKERCPWPN